MSNARVRLNLLHLTAISTILVINCKQWPPVALSKTGSVSVSPHKTLPTGNGTATHGLICFIRSFGFVIRKPLL